MSLADRIAALSPAKKTLLQERSRANRPAHRTHAPRPRQSEGPIPLSYAQELLWLIHQLAPDSSAYNTYGVRRLLGPLDVEALRVAFQTILDRHEALRTGIEETEEGPVQVVLPELRLEVPVLDRPGMSESEQATLARDLVGQPFDLARPPLMRVVVVRLAAEEHLLVTVMHHIVSDGWSKGILHRELVELYDAHRSGRSPELPPVRLQYADFAVWQRDWLRGEAFEQQLTYWRERLRDAAPVLDLPLDRPRPVVQSPRGGSVDLAVTAPMRDALQSVAEGRNATLFMILLASWATLLHSYTGSDDVVIGTPIAGRGSVELEDVFGYFTNTLALRVDCSGDPSFVDLLARARETAVGAYAHQDVPFEAVVRAVAPGRDLSHSPVFQTLLVLQDTTSVRLELSAITIETVPTESGTAKFDLGLAVSQHADGLHMLIEYSSDLFEIRTVERLRDRFAVLLGSIVSDPTLRLSQLSMLTPADVEEMRTSARGPRTPRPAASLAELVCARARTHPDRIAVMADGQQLSYAELNANSATLAGALHARGVRAGSPVGLLADRGAEAVLAILAILRAGGVCVPFDPAHPDERIAVMADGAEVELVLAQGPLRRRASGFDRPVLGLDTPDAHEGQPMWEVQAPAEDDRAFILYTSGSTGVPKGVVLTHAGLANHALATVSAFGLSPADRVLQFASLGFDASLEEILASLISGATLVPRSDTMPLAGPGLVEWLAERRVSVMDLPTAFWHQWVGELKQSDLRPPRCLRLVVVGGEAASSEALSSWRHVAGSDVRWLNTYGPTEASVVATLYEPPEAQTAEDTRPVPIGWPLDNVSLHIVDRDGRPVPPGIRGELYLGGPGVALGYVGQPEVTSERFVRLASAGGERVYRTGDLVRQRIGGPLEFSGRVDRQIKLRGFRIEPAEIEATLSRDPRVRGALVIPRDTAAGSPSLVGYVEVERFAPRLAAELRAQLADTLPSYAVPVAIVALAAFPLTANGKIDHAALPAPSITTTNRSEPPRDEQERAIAAVWTELLGHDVGRHDDFFALGGHSLLAARMAAHIEARCGVRLSLATLIHAPTVATLADMVRGQRPTANRAEIVVTLRPEGNRSPLLLVHDLSGELLCYRDLVRRLAADRPVRGLQGIGSASVAAAAGSVEAIARHHVAALLAEQPRGPYLLAGWSFAGLVAFEMAAQLSAEGREVGFVGLIDAVPARPLAPGDAADAATLVIDGHRSHAEVRESNRVAARRYVPGRYSGRLSLFRARAGGGSEDSVWAPLALGGVDLYDVTEPDVDHYSILTEPHVARLAAMMDEALSRAPSNAND